MPGGPATEAAEPEGSEYWLAFPGNVYPADHYLYITAEAATTGTVTFALDNYAAPFTVTPGQVTRVSVPSGAELTRAEQFAPAGVHVESAGPVSVVVGSLRAGSVDGYLALPVTALGTAYVAAAYEGSVVPMGSQLVLVGTQDATRVTFTLAEAVNGTPAGQQRSVLLDEGETFFVRSDTPGTDLTGSTVSSDKPIAVFSGDKCAVVAGEAPRGSCDHLVEQLVPTSEWGSEFVTAPLAGGAGDTVRVVAGHDDTTVLVDGRPAGTVDAGHRLDLQLTAAARITTTQPVQVVQLSHSDPLEQTVLDPGIYKNAPPQAAFMMTVAPVGLWLTDYAITSPTDPDGPRFTSSFVNVVTPSDSLDVRVDGQPIPADEFTAVGTSGYSAAQVAVTEGPHRLSGVKPFAAAVYGYGPGEGYGYPGGLAVGLDCFGDGLDALAGTPAEGSTGRRAEGAVAPVTGALGPQAGSVVHDAACGVSAAEERVDSASPA